MANYSTRGFRGDVPGTASRIAADNQARRQKADESDPTDPNFRLQQLRARARQTTDANRFSAMSQSAANLNWQIEQRKKNSQTR
jgi:hypothetical protein